MERKLRNDEETTEIESTPRLPTKRVVKTIDGNQAQIDTEGFDFSVLSDFKPYHSEEPLPEPTIKTNKKGIQFLKKPGEPRFFFNGKELIKVCRGLGGKKRSLFWLYDEKRPLHKKIRAQLRKQGIPGA